MAQRKVPVRMCTGCRTSKPKKELVRVVRDPEGCISVDLTGKKSGRGAYICRSEDCLRKARKQKSLERALDCAIEQNVYDRLVEEIGRSQT